MKKSYLVMALPFVHCEAVESTIDVAMGRYGAQEAANGDPARYFCLDSEEEDIDKVRLDVVARLKRTGCVENVYVAEVSRRAG